MPSDPPNLEDLRESARRVAESLLERLALEHLPYIHWQNLWQTLQHLDAAVASALVTALFADRFQTDFEPQSQGYMEGNEIVRLVSLFGSSFEPDIPALFEIYCMRHSEFAAPRQEWNTTKEENVIFFSSDHLALGWQLAWTISRAGLVVALHELRQFQSSSDEWERSAVADLIDDVIRYSVVDDPPQFGGGEGPPDIGASDLTVEREIHDYEEVRVFFGTDRQSAEDAAAYTCERSDPPQLNVGTCVVSIPRIHVEGEVERPSLIRLSLAEDPKKHIVLQKLMKQSRQEFIDEFRNSVNASSARQVIVYIHGYRTTFEDAARQTAQLAYDLDPKLSIVPAFYSWPSRGKFFAYRADLANAEFSKPHLKEFLNIIAQEMGAGTVHIIAHSMGSEALRYAIEDFQTSRRRPAFRDIVLAAPDIDAHVFKYQIAPWLKTKAGRTTVYCSRTDRALWASKLFRRIKAAGDEAIVVDGIDTIDATGLDTSLTRHGYFSRNYAVLSDLYYLLFRGLGPDKRRGQKRVEGANGFYWALAARKRA